MRCLGICDPKITLALLNDLEFLNCPPFKIFLNHHAAKIRHQVHCQGLMWLTSFDSLVLLDPAQCVQNVKVCVTNSETITVYRTLLAYVMDLLMGLFRGAVARKQPVGLDGAFHLFNGPFSSLSGPSPECLNGQFSLLKIPWRTAH